MNDFFKSSSLFQAIFNILLIRWHIHMQTLLCLFIFFLLFKFLIDIILSSVNFFKHSSQLRSHIHILTIPAKNIGGHERYYCTILKEVRDRRMN